MTTLNRKSTFNPQLCIFFAGLLLQAHRAFASDPSNDAQAQVRAFLDPPVVHHVIAAQGNASSPANDRTLMYQDAQQERPVPDSDQNYRVSSDPQEAMRRMIRALGAAPAVALSDAARESLAVGTKRPHWHIY
jgi:hypothetical protein